MTDIYPSANAAAKAWLSANLPGFDIADLPAAIKAAWNALTEEKKWKVLKKLGIYQTYEEQQAARLQQLIATLKVAWGQVQLEDPTVVPPETQEG